MPFRRRRRITAAKITHISLVPRGANRMPVIYKADDQTVDLDMLVKAGDDFMEKGELTALVYAPEVRDSQGDIASAAVIKEMAHEAQKGGLDIDLRHDGAALAKDDAYVAESFIVQKGDPRFEGINDYDGNPVDPTGAWGVVLKIDDPVLRQKYRDGEWNGVSMGGTATVQSEKSDDDVERVIAAMAKLLNGATDDTTDGDIDMDAKELAALLKESNDGLAKSIVDGVIGGIKELVPTAKSDKDTDTDTDDGKTKKREPQPPIFKGDPFNEDDLLAHQKKVALFNIRKGVDFSDPEALAEYMEQVAAFKEQFGDIEPDKPRKRTAKSNVPVGDGGNDDDPQFTLEGVTKEDTDCAKIGMEMAQWANKERGLAPAS